MSGCSFSRPTQFISLCVGFPLPVTLSPLSWRYSASRAPLSDRPTACDNPDTMPRQLTVQEAARELGVSTRTVERRIRAGELASVVVGGRRLVVAPDNWASDTPTDTDRQSHRQPEVHLSPHVGVTDNANRQHDNSDTDTSDTVSVLREQLAKSDERIDRLMGMLEEHNRTIRELNQTNQGLIVRVAQLEGRVLAAETPVHMPAPGHATAAPPRRSWSLRDFYKAWRTR